MSISLPQNNYKNWLLLFNTPFKMKKSTNDCQAIGINNIKKLIQYYKATWSSLTKWMLFARFFQRVRKFFLISVSPVKSSFIFSKLSLQYFCRLLPMLPFKRCLTTGTLPPLAPVRHQQRTCRQKRRRQTSHQKRRKQPPSFCRRSPPPTSRRCPAFPASKPRSRRRWKSPKTTFPSSASKRLMNKNFRRWNKS